MYPMYIVLGHGSVGCYQRVHLVHLLISMVLPELLRVSTGVMVSRLLSEVESLKRISPCSGPGLVLEYSRLLSEVIRLSPGFQGQQAAIISVVLTRLSDPVVSDSVCCYQRYLYLVLGSVCCYLSLSSLDLVQGSVQPAISCTYNQSRGQ